MTDHHPDQPCGCSRDDAASRPGGSPAEAQAFVATCPVCGGPNRCAAAGGTREAGCWCVDVAFPAELLEALDAEDRGTRCICRQCVEHFHATGKLRRYVPG